MAGDYTKFQRHYQSLTTDKLITALTPTTSTLLTVRNSAYAIFIQKISLVPTTYGAETIQFVGSVTGNVYGSFSIPAAAPTTGSDDDYTIDYGPTGLSIAAGENLNLSLSATVVVAALHIEAYQKYAVSGALNAQSGNQ